MGASQPRDVPTDDAVEVWARSGAMALTGRADGRALVGPENQPIALRAVGSAIRRLSARVGTPVDVDAVALLAERAALLNLTRGGDESCGGATRLLPTSDGWIAVSLARPDDLSLVPAWLELTEPVEPDPWPVVRRVVADRRADEIVHRGRLLGLPVARVGEVEPSRACRLGDVELPVVVEPMGDAPPVASMSDVVVADLSSLWAGPLCGSVLALAGARVIKVESTPRPGWLADWPAGLLRLDARRQGECRRGSGYRSRRRGAAGIAARRRRCDRGFAATGARADGHRRQRRAAHRAA